MSSCSDSDDEFYDAEEITPGRASRSGSKRSTLDSHSRASTISSVISLERANTLERTYDDAPSSTNQRIADNREPDVTRIEKIEDDEESELTKRLRELERRTELALSSDNHINVNDKERPSPIIEAVPQNGEKNVPNYSHDCDIKQKLDFNVADNRGNNFDPFKDDCPGPSFVQEKQTFVEPDIIQSAKSATNSLEKEKEKTPEPPPRKKKAAKQYPVEPEDDDRDKTLTPTRFFTPECKTPRNLILNLSDAETPGSLNLKTATLGRRFVETRDDLSTKADSDRDTCDGRSMISEFSTRTEYSDDWSEDSVDTRSGRPRSPSGRLLTDEEILEAVTVKNIDTGDTMSLQVAVKKIDSCANPLTLHLMKRTQDFERKRDSLGKNSKSGSVGKGSKSGSKGHVEDDISMKIREDQLMHDPSDKHKGKRRGPKAFIRNKIGKTVNKIKQKADEVLHKEDEDSDDEVDGKRMIKLKYGNAKKDPPDFTNIKMIQDLSGEHTGAIWIMKFSHCGRLMASGGQDNSLKIWVLKDAYSYFDELRQKYSSETRLSPASSFENMSPDRPDIDTPANATSSSTLLDGAVGGEDEEFKNAPFHNQPFVIYRGHTADLLDLSWSKNYFILSSSMDKTVRLWHISRRECLCSFQHIDFVTAIAFHPRDDRYFLSGSLDGKLRLWNIPDKKVALWHEIPGQKLITAANFCMNGKYAVVGTYDGRCYVLIPETFKRHTDFQVRSTRGKNSRGRKITGIEPLPNEPEKVLITSNDSRLRLYNLRDMTQIYKYKGCTNNSSQIRASISSDGKYIICGSENHCMFIWKTQLNQQSISAASRKDVNTFWESIRAHNAVVTAALFAPNPSLIIKKKSIDPKTGPESKSDKNQHPGEIIVSADFNGSIKVFKNRFRQS